MTAASLLAPPLMRPALRIAHLVAPGEVGGLERVLLALALGHAAAGHAVRVVAVLDHAGACASLVEELRAGGVGVDVVVVPPRAYVAERRAVATHLAAFAPDVVHSHGYRADLVGAPAARSVGARRVTTVHGFTGGGLRNRLYEALQRASFRRFDAVIAVSRPLAERLRRAGVAQARLHCVPNAYASAALPSRAAARALLGLGADAAPRLGWVGRLSREKGADVLLRAMADPAFPAAARVSFVGDGPERTALEALARTLGIAARVRFHGLVARARDATPAFDAFVLSSRTEGTPVTLFEAIDAGVPVVATRVGGVPDVLGDDGGLLVAPEDPAALARAIAQVLADRPASARRAGAARHRMAHRHDAAEWLRRYESVYLSLLSGRPAAARRP